MTFCLTPNHLAIATASTSAATAMQDHLLRQVELSYVAGFADGEAFVGFSKTTQPGRKNPSYRLLLSFTQNHLGSLQRVAKVLKVPPRIYEVKRLTQHNRQIYTLAVGDQDAYAALGLLLPHLDRKQPEAIVAREGYVACQLDVHPGCKGHSDSIWKLRERYYRKLRRMKKAVQQLTSLPTYSGPTP
jgi:hypothetical protein